MYAPRSLPGFCFLVLLPFLAGACSGDVAEEVDEVQAAGFVAAATPDPGYFDSIQWDDPHAALDRGATVFAYSCAKCHGDSGAGDGNYQLNRRVLRPPSFRTADWRFGHDLEGLRVAIYTGNDKGMPHWGDAGLAARDVDAVARYILHGLRNDVF